MSDQSTASVGHPTPHGNRVGLTPLLFGFWGGPIAWIGQALLNYGFSSYVCYPGPVPRTSVLEGWRWLPSALFGVDALALLISFAAAALSWRSYAITKQEMQGDHHHLLEVGEGRSRFLALCGLLTSASFFVVIAFNTLSLILVPLCSR